MERVTALLWPFSMQQASRCKNNAAKVMLLPQHAPRTPPSVAEAVGQTHRQVLHCMYYVTRPGGATKTKAPTSPPGIEHRTGFQCSYFQVASPGAERHADLVSSTLLWRKPENSRQRECRPYNILYRRETWTLRLHYRPISPELYIANCSYSVRVISLSRRLKRPLENDDVNLARCCMSRP